MKLFKKTFLVIASIFLGSLTMQAQDNTRELSSLLNMKSNYLEQEMQKHGYKHIKTEKSGTSAYAYWWNSNRNKCVTSRVTDAKVKSIVNTMPFDCGKTSDNSHSSNNHSNDSQDEAYKRGVKDAKRGFKTPNAYSSQVLINAYDRGFNSSNNSHGNHHNNGHHSKTPKYTDLNGWVATSAYAVLKERGFKEVKKFSEGDTTYRLWYHNGSDLCIKTESKHKKIAKIFKSNSENCPN
ncbi:hypothetical protein KO493_08910 [Tamlana agarivorans]|uniref:Uncharacterized protein n=1 Tax=Pseudotamlana agarivorans TaxID=481183 RepID=A0ACC5U9E8_9FLAO|nr:hypothetical protein [Tamlana agarivorans]MBU2950815.1 hypothetical protein [Tamlana agarivorans]